MVMAAEDYLKENIDDHIIIKPWSEKNKLPVFLRNNYNFYEMAFLGMSCIMVEITDDKPGVDTLQNHIKRIETLAGCKVVLFYKEITRYRRKSLIENRIPFVIEDGQMYLPFLGLDLKKSPKYVEKEVLHFNTSAQIAYLYFLYHKDELINITRFAKQMGVTKMTASRALNDLYHANLITCKIVGKTGRSKEYLRIQDPDYFLKGCNYIKSPVKKIVYAKTKPINVLTAGLDALADLSMINPPDHPIVAVCRDQFIKQKIDIIDNKDLIKDEKLVEIQIWEYDPRQFSDKNHVDLLSLYMSLKEGNDERIEQALEEALRDESWYTV